MLELLDLFYFLIHGGVGVYFVIFGGVGVYNIPKLPELDPEPEFILY